MKAPRPKRRAADRLADWLTAIPKPITPAGQRSSTTKAHGQHVLAEARVAAFLHEFQDGPACVHVEVAHLFSALTHDHRDRSGRIQIVHH